MNTQKQILLIVVLMFAFVGGCAAYASIDLSVRAPSQEEWHLNQSIERGALLYANNCRTCHGNEGQGGVGLPLNIDKFKDQDPLVLKNNQDMLRRTISCGRTTTAMPAWLNTNGGALNSTQIQHIVNFITAPADDEYEDGTPTSTGWVDALEFAHNLNRETAVVVGGDTLGTIAQAHGVGYQELADLNGLQVNSAIAHGDKVKLPPNNQFPEGRTVTVLKDNQNVVKVANDNSVGAIEIAELNNIDYKLDTKTNTLTIHDENGNPVAGLFPGSELRLPDGASYVVRSGDTLTNIAEQHNVTVSGIQNLNTDTLRGVGPEDELESQFKLLLPSNPVVVVQEGQSLGLIASQHGLTSQELADANGIAATATVTTGQELKLPANTRYNVQAGDTLESVAQAHKTDAATLASLNNLQPDSPIGPEVILAMPKIDRFVVAGQSLEDVAKTYSNVTVDSLAEANNVESNVVFRVGSSLVLPETAWGAAPPSAVNLGVACTQYTIPNSLYESLVSPTVEPTAPPTQTTQLNIIAHANDWTMEADGVSSEPNKGVASVAVGTVATFRNDSGLHTITVNKTKEGANFEQGQTRTFQFSQPNTTYVITCDFHAAMTAYVFTR